PGTFSAPTTSAPATSTHIQTTSAPPLTTSMKGTFTSTTITHVRTTTTVPVTSITPPCVLISGMSDNGNMYIQDKDILVYINDVKIPQDAVNISDLRPASIIPYTAASLDPIEQVDVFINVAGVYIESVSLPELFPLSNIQSFTVYVKLRGTDNFTE
ncbi:hypothetical protein ACJMK2_024166, partial [Sinanodonta woodiana]